MRFFTEMRDLAILIWLKSRIFGIFKSDVAPVLGPLFCKAYSTSTQKYNFLNWWGICEIFVKKWWEFTLFYQLSHERIFRHKTARFDKFSSVQILCCDWLVLVTWYRFHRDHS